MTKQEQIDDLLKKLQEAYEIIADLKKAKDADFEKSPLYQRMRRDLILTEKLKDYEDMFRRQNRTDMELAAQNKQLLDDNRLLCQEHDFEYWVGLSNPRLGDYFALRKLENENIELRAKMAAKDEIIEHLKSILAGEDISTPAHRTPTGRPKIDDATKKRIRKLYREGWTMKEISEAEGVSKGFVCQTCKGIERKKKEKGE